MYTDRCNECYRKDTILYECYYCNRVFCYEHAAPRTPDNPVGHFCPEFEARLAAKKAELEARKAEMARQRRQRDEWKPPKPPEDRPPLREPKRDSFRDSWKPPEPYKEEKPPNWNPEPPGQPPDYGLSSKKDYYMEKSGGSILNFLIVMLILVIVAIALYRIFLME